MIPEIPWTFTLTTVVTALIIPVAVWQIVSRGADRAGLAPGARRRVRVGTALFLVTPAFLWLFAGLRGVGHDIATRAVAIAALLALLPDILHGTVGFQQFGYRFSLDVQPFLVALALAGDARSGTTWRERPSWLFVGVVVTSVAVNVYAMIAITRFSYWQ